MKNLIIPAPTILITSGTFSSRGVSDTADFVRIKTDAGRRQLQKSFALGLLEKGTFSELYQIAQNCEKSNWDGYGADPVTDDTYRQAYRFLEVLPLGIPAPSIGAEPDGHITFEWYHTPRQVLSVSVSPDGELNYAAFLPGPRKVNGKEQFVGTIPTGILKLVRDVVPTKFPKMEYAG